MSKQVARESLEDVREELKRIAVQFLRSSMRSDAPGTGDLCADESKRYYALADVVTKAVQREKELERLVVEWWRAKNFPCLSDSIAAGETESERDWKYKRYKRAHQNLSAAAARLAGEVGHTHPNTVDARESMEGQ